jgi:ABC-type phosphate/phosphonate transport system substrate-binding protein
MAIALLAVAVAAAPARAAVALSDQAAGQRGLTLVVMDPLALPLSCPCVAGYAQRRYEKLAEFLQHRLGQPVHVVFTESLVEALQQESSAKADSDGLAQAGEPPTATPPGGRRLQGRPDTPRITPPYLVIGKDSVVRSDARQARCRLAAVARLTGTDGTTTQTGLFVVRAADPAQTLADLDNHRIFFGPSECDEKHAAALALLRQHGVHPPPRPETSAACSEGALRVLELGAADPAAAVISSYAKPLLEGCGTVERGALRVVGETRPVPFITAFVDARLAADTRHRLTDALLQVGDQVELCQALETLTGFIAVTETARQDPDPNRSAEKKVTAAAKDWAGWRGPGRDAQVDWLPDHLPATPRVVWQQPLLAPAHAGVAATSQYVVVADRSLDDTTDLFHCLDADTGTPQWTVQYPASGTLDYGNSPRATPLIWDDTVYLFGAFGDLHAVELATGLVIWQKNLRREFGITTRLVWGTCSSPLMADGRLIVNPGAPASSIAALDPQTGAVLWQTPGNAAAYGSLIEATFGGVRQIVGHDRISLGGWDVRTGRRLWTLVPPHRDDFNVPTPIAVDGQLLVVTENNGTRLYAFDQYGRILPTPRAINEQLAPDTSTPVVVGRSVFGCWGELFCLDLDRQLQPRWTADRDVFADHVTLIGGPNHILVITLGGQALLVSATGDRYTEIARMTLFDGAESYSHPALVNRRLFVRGADTLWCLALD